MFLAFLILFIIGFVITVIAIFYKFFDLFKKFCKITAIMPKQRRRIYLIVLMCFASAFIFPRLLADRWYEYACKNLANGTEFVLIPTIHESLQKFNTDIVYERFRLYCTSPRSFPLDYSGLVNYTISNKIRYDIQHVGEEHRDVEYRRWNKLYELHQELINRPLDSVIYANLIKAGVSQKSLIDAGRALIIYGASPAIRVYNHEKDNNNIICAGQYHYYRYIPIRDSLFIYLDEIAKSDLYSVLIHEIAHAITSPFMSYLLNNRYFVSSINKNDSISFENIVDEGIATTVEELAGRYHSAPMEYRFLQQPAFNVLCPKLEDAFMLEHNFFGDNNQLSESILDFKKDDELNSLKKVISTVNLKDYVAINHALLTIQTKK